MSILDPLKRVERLRRADAAREHEGSEGRVPPGQVLTDKFPVLTYGSTPRVDRATWRLKAWGLLAREREWGWDEFLALPTQEQVSDIHCVTRWSRFDASFTGVPWRVLAERVRPTGDARFAIAHAEHGFTANVPAADLDLEGALLVTHADGEPLTPEHGWPLRLVVPGRYFWKSAKWLRGIELTSDDRPGFWERYGYHNDADPWQEERFSA